MTKMLKLKKITISIIFALLISSLLIFPEETLAEEWVYDGVDTVNVPNFSVYPSEYYLYNYSEDSGLLGFYNAYEIIKGNTTDTYFSNPMGANGVSIWVNNHIINATTGEKTLIYRDVQVNYWNESVGYAGITPIFIPLEENGKISEFTLYNATKSWEKWGPYYVRNFENFAININYYSCIYWNSSYNSAYFILNYTENGILTRIEPYNIGGWENITLYSKPTQLAPIFDITTESDEYLFSSPNIKLNIDIEDSDNNNDGIIDSEYSYRMYYNHEWSNWSNIPTFIDWNLGNVTEGAYNVIIEVKNMYGISNDEILINYNPSEEIGSISGYSTILFTISIICISLLLLYKKYKK